MRRPALGVRAHLAIPMLILAVGSVALTGLLIHHQVARQLAEGEEQLTDDLQASVVRTVAEAGLIAGALALFVAVVIAFRVARPLRRLNELAERLADGEIAPAHVGVGGGRELDHLGRTLESLAAMLQRQDAVRRATAADALHELHGALGGVLGRIEAVQDGAIDPEAGLRRAADDARRLGRILDDLPGLVDAQRPPLLVCTRVIELAPLVDDRIAVYAGRFESASITLERYLSATSVDGDPERLVQVVDNLLGNALRYTDPGGIVRVSLIRAERESVIEVADSGIGIPTEALDHVFDRFWRAPGARERAPEGSGVGLALVRDLVLAHGGRVSVLSEPGIGSRFRVHLPLPPPAEAGESEPEPDRAHRALAADAAHSARRGVTPRVPATRIS
jgi:two-component system, OmpR family, sensor histidine kinase BaeS